MKIKNFLKYFFIISIAIGILGLWQMPYCSAEPSLNQRLKQTNKQRNLIKQKKQQADLRLRREKNKLSNNQQRLENAHVKLQENTVRYNNLVTNLSSMESQLSTAVSEFQRIDRAMKLRINGVYKHQRRGMFELILSANSINSLLDTLYYEKIIIQRDYKRMQQMKTKADEIARLKAQVVSQKRMIEASIREIKSQRITIQNSIQS